MNDSNLNFKYDLLYKNIENMHQALDSGFFTIASEYCEKILESDPENAQAYVCRLLVRFKVTSIDGLENATERFDELADYQKAVMFSDSDIAEQLRFFAEQTKQKFPKSVATVKVQKTKTSDKAKKLLHRSPNCQLHLPNERCSATAKNFSLIIKCTVRFLIIVTLLTFSALCYVLKFDVWPFIIALLAGVAADAFISIKVLKIKSTNFIRKINIVGFPIILLLLYYIPMLSYSIVNRPYSVFSHHLLNVLGIIAHMTPFVVLARAMFNKKRIISFISTSGAAAAAFIVVFLLYISPFRYEKLTDGTYTVIGTRNPSLSEAIIPDEYFGKPITKIKKHAFESLSLKDVTIGNNVTTIGDCSFCGCTELKSVTIGNNVKAIESSAFRGCTSLTSITLPNNVTNIGDSAFSGCIGLTNITIGKGVINIGYAAFYNCVSLTKINFNATNCADLPSPSLIYIPGFITHKLNDSFFNAGANTTGVIVNFGDTVKSIPANLFHSVSNIKSITIPNSVTNIGDRAFSGCTGISSITIPNSVKSIGVAAFSGCSGLTRVTISDGLLIPNNNLTNIGDSAFSNCSGLMSITIPHGVKSIGNSAFANCTELAHVTIPNSVKSIGSSAFTKCSSHMLISYKGTETQWNSVSKGGAWALFTNYSISYIY